MVSVTARGSVRPALASLGIVQEFTNAGPPADVTCHFPLHPDWAVGKVTMRCGDRTIETEIVSDRQGAATFDRARQQGHAAILAEEHAADELRLQLANVPAGADVRITTEIIATPAVYHGRGSVLIPLINGPRYGGSEAQQPDIAPLDPDARATTCHLDLRLHVAGARTDVGRIEGDRIRCEIPPVGQVTIDFDAEPAALYHEDDSGRYLVVGVPPLPAQESRDWGETALLLDRSGSMGGQGIAVAAAMARDIAGRLGDALRCVYAFDTTCTRVWAAAEAEDASAACTLSAVDAISRVSAGGGTELGAALERVRADLSGQITELVLITDALVSQDECGALVRAVRALSEAGVAVHVILVGPSPGRFIADCISHAAGGLYLEQAGSTYDAAELNQAVTRFLTGGAMVVGVGVDGGALACRHVIRGGPVMLPLAPEAPVQAVTIELEGQPSMDAPVVACPEARAVWARQRVMDIVRGAWAEGRSIDHCSDEIRSLGLEHRILTPFTAMVGVDASRTCEPGEARPVVARASLPVGIDARTFAGRGGCLHRTAYRAFAVSLPGDPARTFHRTDPGADGSDEQGVVEEATRLLAAILRGAKTAGEAAGLELLIGPWVALYSRSAIALAAVALWNAGCNGLGALLIWEARLSLAAVNRTEAPAGRLLTLAEEIAGRLRQRAHRL